MKVVDSIPSWVPPKLAIMGANDSLLGTQHQGLHLGGQRGQGVGQCGCTLRLDLMCRNVWEYEIMLVIKKQQHQVDQNTKRSHSCPQWPSVTPRTTGRRRRWREQTRSGTWRFLKPADSSCYKCMSVATPEQGHIRAGCQPHTQTHVSMIYLPILFCFLECSQKSQRHHFLSPIDFKQQEKTSTPLWDFSFTPMACVVPGSWRQHAA